MVKMAKFYVCSGELNEIVIAQDAESAALEALDRFFAEMTWVFDDPTLSDNERRDHFAVEALMRLGSTVQVSQRGFRDEPAEWTLGLPTGQIDPLCLDTADLLDLHFRLAVAMRRFLCEFEDLQRTDAEEMAAALVR